MTRPTGSPGAVLATGLLAVAVLAMLPAGLGGGAVPAWSFVVWTTGLVASIAIMTAMRGSAVHAVRHLGWLLPPALLLTLPVAAFAAAGDGLPVAAALVLRALAAAGAGLATMAVLGPSGVVNGLRSLGVPTRLVEAVHAMLVGVSGMTRQVSAMMRARAARRPSGAPWSSLFAAPLETLAGFGRLVGSLLLRSMERAESLERARRARGGGGS